jgi:hypothetical protein
MTTSIEPIIARGEGLAAENLGQYHIAVERKHERPFALRSRSAALAWQDTPDWRFHRQVMRVGLYLQERARVEPNERVALISRLRPEWVVALWGSLVQGAGVAVVNPDVPDADLAVRLSALAPRAVFVDGATFGRVASRRAALRGATIVALDGDGARQGSATGGRSTGAAPEVVSFTEALDLGGSLDTAERANAFRAQAKALSPETPALGHAVGSDGSVAWRFSSHREVVHRVQRVWSRARIARGDTAYAVASIPTIATAVEVLAFTGDGHTQLVLGTAGHELEEIAMTRPHKIMAGAEVVRRLIEALPTSKLSLFARAQKLAAAAGAWVPLVSRVTRSSDGGFARSTGDDVPALERARWISTGPALEFATRARARRLVTLEIDDSLA